MKSIVFNTDKFSRYSEKRDAWGTIRGYVYQANMTIVNWLGLKNDEVLQLEYGEDIDRISISHQSSRTLIQVKHDEDNITLRNSEAKKAMQSFYQHITNNEDSNLTFVYVTNSKITKEQGMSESGIALWEQLRTNLVPLKKVDEKVRLIRNVLQTIKNPDGIGEEQWEEWQKYIKESSDFELYKFIQYFEWNTGNGSLVEIEGRIINSLMTREKCNAEKAKRLYLTLFHFVFSKLSQKGLKELAIKELETQLKSADFGLTDDQMIEDILDLFDKRYEQFVGEIKETIESFKINTNSKVRTIAIRIKENIEEALINLNNRTEDSGINVQLIKIPTNIESYCDDIASHISSNNYSILISFYDKLQIVNDSIEEIKEIYKKKRYHYLSLISDADTLPIQGSYTAAIDELTTLDLKPLIEELSKLTK